MKRYAPWFVIVVLMALYSAALFALYANHPVSASDFNVYYRGSTRLIQGDPLYANLQSNDYVGPSLIIQLLAPLIAAVDYSTAINVWLAISLAAAFASTLMIADLFSKWRTRLIFWLLSIALLPTFLALWIGQFAVVLFFMLVLAWWLYRCGFRIPAGVVLGIAIWTKFFPALLVVYFAWKRDWRVVISAVGGTVAAVLFQIAGTGLATFVEYYTRILPTLAVEGQPLFAAANHAVLGFAQKTFLDVRNGIPLVESDLLMTLTRYSLTALLVVTLFYLTFSRRTAPVTPVERFDVEYTLALTVALLLGSTLGYYGIQAALLPFAVIWRYSRHGIAVKLWLIAALSLIDFNLMLTLAHLRIGSETRVSWLVLSTPFFGMMILWGWLVLILRRQSLKPDIHTSSSPSA